MVSHGMMNWSEPCAADTCRRNICEAMRHAYVCSAKSPIAAVTGDIEFVVQVPYADNHVNALQAKWARAVLACCCFRRIVMMTQVGMGDRLFATASARTLILAQASEAGP